MGVLLTTMFALSLWLVLWALDVKAFDAAMLAAALVLVAYTARVVARYLPGRS